MDRLYLNRDQEQEEEDTQIPIWEDDDGEDESDIALANVEIPTKGLEEVIF